MSAALDAFYAMYYRQVKRWATARSRVISSIIQPIIWLLFLGVGLGNMFNLGGVIPASAVKFLLDRLFGGVDYLTFLTAGLVVMTGFIGSFMSGLSVIWDKQFGFLKESLVAPAPRSASLLGRTLGDATVNTIQSLLIIIIAIPIVHHIRIVWIPMALLYVFVMSIGFTGMGIMIALKFSSIEGFQFLVNLVTMPLLFMSGVFYPLTTLPQWLRILNLLNPLAYAVDGERYWLIGVSKGVYFMNPTTDLVVLTAMSLIIMLVAVRMFEYTTIED